MMICQDRLGTDIRKVEETRAGGFCFLFGRTGDERSAVDVRARVQDIRNDLRPAVVEIAVRVEHIRISVAVRRHITV